MLPTTKLYRLDLQFIADNCLDRKLWGKKWNIFQYDKVSIDLFILNIDIEDGKLRLGIKMSTTDHGSFGSHGFFSRGDVVIPLDKGKQNMLNAKRQVVSAIRSRVLSYEYHIASKYIGYKRAESYDEAVREEARRRAIKLLDEEEITNDDIRAAYIDACKDRVSTSRASEFLSTSARITRPHYYLMLEAYFYPEDKKRYESALLETKVNVKERKYLEYIEEMTEYIKAVRNDEDEEYISEIEMDFEDIR